MDISIIIPNYNGESLLKRNLPKVVDAISGFTGGYIEIVIVDDASSDNSVEGIKYYVESIKYKNIKFKVLINERNMGFSTTINKGAKEATGDLVLLLNTDVVPEKNFLDSLIKHFEDEKVFAVGCMDKSVGNGKTVLRGRGLGKWKRGFLVHSRGEVDKTNTLWVNGGSGIFRKSMWHKLGGFDELYNPFYWEDIDLSYRALKSGYKIIFESKSIVFHEHEKGAIKSSYSKAQIKIIAYKNQFIFAWKNATDLDLQFLHLLWLPYHFLKALVRGDWSFFLGFIQAFVLIPRIIRSSFRAQRLFVRSDKEVIRKFL